MQRDIAIVGMVCRLPGAHNIEEFWNLLKCGREGLRSLTEDELAQLGVARTENYVAAGGFINDIDKFDGNYFNFSAREMSYMDPQHRLWLHACWHALQVSGHAGLNHPYIGVFASMGPNTYLPHVLKNINEAEHQAVLLANVPDTLATRVSHSLNLTGPSMTIQCGCSSSLVALHHARLALLAKQCDVALAGGICITVPHQQGYRYTEGGFASPDGHCRPFAEDAKGTVFSSGYGVVVIKRLADAITAGDNIYAVIKGSAINNDGAEKASFTAPSVQGQAEVIAKALRVAGLQPTDIQYIEAHGTGTPIGDPIELRALTQALPRDDAEQYYIGSVKANLGHLDVASGIVGVIKTALMLHHKQIPPQIHFNNWHPNARAFAKNFKVNTKLMDWNSKAKQYAGVSSFGFGGSNAHIILESSPDSAQASKPHALSQLMILSEKSPKYLMRLVKTLHDHLQQHPALKLHDLTYTLQTGCKQLSTRFVTHASSIQELISILDRVMLNDFVECDLKTETIAASNDAHAIARKWLQGYQVNWQSAYENHPVQKVLLPIMPLDETSYWIDNDVPDTPKNDPWQFETDPQKWVYQSYWQEQFVDADAKLAQPIAIFGTANKALSQSLIEYCSQQQCDFYVITEGEKFKKINDHHYEINFQQGNDYRALEAQLSNENRLPKLALLNLSMTELNEHENPLTVPLNIIKLPNLFNGLQQLSMMVCNLSAFVCEQVNPLPAMLIGFMRGMGQEYPHIKTQLIDFTDKETQHHIQQLMQTLHSNLNDVIVWRDNKCWQQHYQVQKARSTEATYFKKGGVYLITGGLGDVASVHVDYLAKNFDAQLILLGRSQLPDKNEWATILKDDHTDKKLKQKITRLQHWQSQNYRIHYESGDINDVDRMRVLCRTWQQHFGEINGIIHIAGAGSDMHYKTLSDLTWQHCWQLFLPKLNGLETIATLQAEFGIADCLVISSISSALTGIGLSAYGASHNVLDAIVKTRHPHFRIMNWDAWNFYQDEQKAHGELGSQMDKLAIKPAQGLAILEHAFSLPAWQQLYISAATLQSRVDYWAHRGFLATKTQSKLKYPRPHLATEYIAPQSNIHERLVSLWQGLLGLEKIGIHDSFFELGGHSLLALECVNGLQKEFNYVCSVVDLFAAPTIAKLAEKISPAPQTNTVDVVNVAASRALKQLTARRAQFDKRD